MSDRTLIAGLARALIDAAQTYEAGKEWPAILLWPDPDRQWFASFADLRGHLASREIALYAHGKYAPEEGVGPSIWLRCLVEAPDAPGLRGAIPLHALPVVLLPGISWRNLREPLTLPRGIQILVEMQYRGDVFRQRRQARDWTVATFLRDPDQGLGLDVATDSRTDEAVRRALPGLLDLELDGWRHRTLSADDFDGLLVEDKERDLLRWIAEPEVLRNSRNPEAWSAFRDLVRREYSVDIEDRGAVQNVVDRLIRRTGPWGKLWNRLADSPQQFRPVCERIRLATGTKTADMFSVGDPATNPHDNALAEKSLMQELSDLINLPSREAANKIVTLEERNRIRRDTLWARLGEAPLAAALEPLARLAAATDAGLPGDDLTALSSAYAEDGWRVDATLIETIATAGTREEVIARVAGSLYRPWVDALARRFRSAYEAAGATAGPSALVVETGTLVLFVDGLRMDIGYAVLAGLHNAGAEAGLTWRLAPVPSLTATAKGIVTPVGDSISGKGKVDAFLPLEMSSGRPATADVLRRAMLSRGIQVLDRGSVLPPEKPTSIGYAECGNIDNDGHAMGLRLAGQIETEVTRILECALAYRAAGWPRVRIVTDHGWLLMPGGFDPIRLPPSAVIAKGARAAVLKDEAAADIAFVPWHWDKSVRIALPPGAEAFRGGEVYSHGGLSPQESVIPDITVGSGEFEGALTARISAIIWRRLRLTVELSGDLSGTVVEVRRAERDPHSRIDVSCTLEGTRARLAISDEINEGESVFVVILDRRGMPLDVRATRVGDRV